MRPDSDLQNCCHCGFQSGGRTGRPSREFTGRAASAHGDMESAIAFERDAAGLDGVQPARGGGDAAE
jgi:hypothetical protein